MRIINNEKIGKNVNKYNSKPLYINDLINVTFGTTFENNIPVDTEER